MVKTLTKFGLMTPLRRHKSWSMLLYHWPHLVGGAPDTSCDANATSQCKKDITPLLMHRSYVFLALTHWIVDNKQCLWPQQFVTTEIHKQMLTLIRYASPVFCRITEKHKQQKVSLLYSPANMQYIRQNVCNTKLDTMRIFSEYPRKQNKLAMHIIIVTQHSSSI